MRTRTLTLLLTLAGLAPAGLRAQASDGAVTGSVLGSDTNAPLATATLTVRSVSDSSSVATGLTDARGTFRIGGVPPGRYHLVIAYLGYGERWTEPFEVRAGFVRDLGALTLVLQAIELDPISVSAERSPVTFETDRTSYLLDGMVMAEGGAVMDALQGIPDVDVDIDGAIRLRDSSPAIYIDGRPAPISGQSLTIFLEQFPSDHIERIEVIENPSARFAAEGSGGIINIVLKEGVELGLSGSVFLNGGTRGQWGAGARGTMQKDRWTFTGGVSTRWSDAETSGWNLRQNLLVDPVTFLRQDTRSDRSGISGSFDFQTRFQATEKARLWFRTNLGGSGSDRDGLTVTTHMDASEDPTLRYDRFALAEGSRASASARTGFEYVWERRRHEFQVEATVERGWDREDSREEIAEDSIFDVDQIVPAELTLELEREFETEVGLDVDYERPMGENGSLELGWELEAQDVDSRHRLRLVDDPEIDPDGLLEDQGVLRNELTNSGFVSMSRSFGDFGVQAGLRGENVTLDFEIPTGEVIERSYFDLFPSLSLSFSHDRSKRLRLSYSRRIGRPGTNVLDPTNRSTDPLNRSVGNPDIEPQYTHSISLSGSWSGSLGSLSIGPYWRRTTNGWERITSVDEEGVSTRTWDNLASQTNWGASIRLSLRRRGSWGGWISLTGSRSIRDASNLADRFSGDSFRWSTRANINGTVFGELRAQGSLSYSPPVDLPQGRAASSKSADFSLRYRFMDNRASFGLNLRDPFLLRQSRTRIVDPSVLETGSTRESTRSMQFTVSYSLGGRGSRGGG